MFFAWESTFLKPGETRWLQGGTEVWDLLQSQKSLRYKEHIQCKSPSTLYFQNIIN